MCRGLALACTAFVLSACGGADGRNEQPGSDTGAVAGMLPSNPPRFPLSDDSVSPGAEGSPSSGGDSAHPSIEEPVASVQLHDPSSEQCDPNYEPCVPIASDVDCAGGRGNGPAYVEGPIHVIGRDIYRLDRDGDGIACEN